mmetsp:Transcript_23227/g.30078  ORF Transcript_23227/g.30078 Transcript_23227/m.30078 type:complete len:234 (-) Transcript_23227:169-870(-)
MSSSEMELRPPTAQPISSGPVYVTIVPGVRPVAGGRFTIASGFTNEDNAELHTLSKSVVQLAMINCLLTVTLRVIGLIVVLVYGWYSQMIMYTIDIIFAILVMWLGVQGVKTRNAQGSGCCCGYLTAFYIMYIILSVLEAIAVLIALIEGYIIVIVDFAFLCLYIYTAEQTRKLLELLGREGGTGSTGPHHRSHESTHVNPTIAVAEATDVTILSNSTNDQSSRITSRATEEV